MRDTFRVQGRIGRLFLGAIIPDATKSPPGLRWVNTHPWHQRQRVKQDPFFRSLTTRRGHGGRSWDHLNRMRSAAKRRAKAPTQTELAL